MSNDRLNRLVEDLGRLEAQYDIEYKPSVTDSHISFGAHTGKYGVPITSYKLSDLGLQKIPETAVEPSNVGAEPEKKAVENIDGFTNGEKQPSRILKEPNMPCYKAGTIILATVMDIKHNEEHMHLLTHDSSTTIEVAIERVEAASGMDSCAITKWQVIEPPCA